MARIKPQEIIRRTAVAPRHSEVPVLAVSADLAPAMSAGALSKTAAAVLSRVSDSINSQMISKSRDEYADAAAQRMQEDAEGTPRQTEEFVAQQSEAWRRGYLKADGIIRIRDWQIEAAKELAKAEPGEDIEPLLKERMAALTRHPEFQDPQVRKALMPVAQRAAQQIRQQWQADSMREMLERQKESLTAIIRDGIKSGAFLTSEGMDGLYAMLDQEEYAYLTKRDVDELYVGAAKEELASGNRDPQEILAFLEKPRPDGQPGLMNTEHGDELRAAARAGAQVIAKRLDEAQKQAMAEAEWTLQGLADRGQLTHKVIDQYAAKFGLAGGDLMQFRRYWSNQQEQTLRRWESEAKERARENKYASLIASGNYYAVPDAELKKMAGAEWDATPQAQRGALIQKWARLGVPIPQLERILKRADPASRDNFQQAASLYESLRKVSPKYADTVAGGEAAAMFDQYLFDTKRGGQSHQEAARVLTQPKREAEEARAIVGDAWKDAIKDYTEIDGKPRDARELYRIRQEAERIASRGGISGEAAIRAAVGQIDAQRTVINGRRVPNIGMPQGAEPAVDELIQAVAKRLGREPEELSALPNPRNPGQWQIVGPDNWIIADPDTGRPIGFDPRAVAAQHQRWKGDLAEYRARREAEQRGRDPWRESQDAARQLHEARSLEVPATIARPSGSPEPAYQPFQLDLSKPLVAGGRAAAPQPTTTPGVPEDFLEYLTRK